jgi:hypothetical protein
MPGAASAIGQDEQRVDGGVTWIWFDDSWHARNLESRRLFVLWRLRHNTAFLRLLAEAVTLLRVFNFEQTQI